MNALERVMRVMTHLNIGAALGMVAWVAWSGWQVVTGQVAPIAPIPLAAHPVVHAEAPHAALSASRQGLEPATREPVPPCHAAAPADHPATRWTGDEL